MAETSTEGTGTIEALSLVPKAEARERALSIVVGSGFSPGLTCVLARHGGSGFDSIQQVHVAKTGTGGPACARHLPSS